VSLAPLIEGVPAGQALEVVEYVLVDKLSEGRAGRSAGHAAEQTSDERAGNRPEGDAGRASDDADGGARLGTAYGSHGTAGSASDRAETRADPAAGINGANQA
jgi:hypothetical protein